MVVIVIVGVKVVNGGCFVSVNCCVWFVVCCYIFVVIVLVNNCFKFCVCCIICCFCFNWLIWLVVVIGILVSWIFVMVNLCNFKGVIGWLIVMFGWLVLIIKVFVVFGGVCVRIKYLVVCVIFNIVLIVLDSC